MKRYAQTFGLLALLACVTSRAQAASIFTFTFTGGGITAAGTLDASPNGDGTFTATDGAGTIMGAAVDGTMTLIPNPNPPGPATYDIVVEPPTVLTFYYDNQLLPGQDPLITRNGLFFSLPGGALLNIYWDGFFGPDGNYSLFEYSSAGVSYVPGGGFFSLTTVPEPPSLVHMVSVGLAVAGLAWWRRKARPIAA
jgi:hypothetical protein